MMPRALFVLLLVATLFAQPTHAATIKAVDLSRFDNQHNGSIDVDSGLGQNLRNEADIVCNFLLEGPIEAGDTGRLKTAIDANRDKVGTNTPRLCLHSPGGLFSEGLALTRFLIDTQIGTAVPRNGQCYSSCAVIFMGGSYPWKGEINRYLDAAGIVGFHAPYLPGKPTDDTEQTNRTEVRRTFTEAIDAISSLVKLGVGNDVKRFPPELLQELLDKGPDDLFNIDTVGKAIRFRVHLYGIARPPEINETSICNACVNMNYGAREDYGTTGLTNDLCTHPGEARWNQYPKGKRLTLDVAPRGGTCSVDVSLSGQTITGWMFANDEMSEWNDGLELAYWYLLTPSTRLADLAGASPAIRSPPLPQDQDPQPVAGPSTSGTTSQDEFERRLVEFLIKDYLGHGMADHIGSADLYADSVTYYDKGRITRDGVFADQLSYYKKWPKRTYVLIPNSMRATPNGNKPLEVSFRYTFQVANASKSASGIGTTTLGIEIKDGRFVIVSENGRVLEKY